MLRETSLFAGGLFLAVALGLVLNAPAAYANKVDCGKVMAEVGAGKKAGAIAKDLNISTSSVYKCKRRAKDAKSGAKASPAGSPAAAASPVSH